MGLPGGHGGQGLPAAGHGHTYVELVTTRMGKTTTQEMDPGAFRAAYGFAPAQMVDLKALMGDSSDNVPRGSGGGGENRSDPAP